MAFPRLYTRRHSGWKPSPDEVAAVIAELEALSTIKRMFPGAESIDL